MVIQDIYEMWQNAQPKLKAGMPNFGPSFKKRVMCADCGTVTWPGKVQEKGKER
jgi:hypothetical protein